ncbi:MAG: S8 family serine peptidase, partial [Natronohydrobacter sp.]|nr:S8 family serine peptidase [Natronohydrobacter sp.]
FDYLNRDLAGLRTTIFVGALERNGTVSNPAAIADYSARAGSDRAYRRKFLVVGVPSNIHGLAGTSFAAPVVSGYAAILGSKFRDARPRDISKQLLTTARTDRILNYDKRVHGRGEASLRRALAPVSIR